MWLFACNNDEEKEEVHNLFDPKIKEYEAQLAEVDAKMVVEFQTKPKESAVVPCQPEVFKEEVESHNFSADLDKYEVITTEVSFDVPAELDAAEPKKPPDISNTQPEQEELVNAVVTPEQIQFFDASTETKFEEESNSTRKESPAFVPIDEEFLDVN